jgi:hypothetical protein
MWYRNRDDRSAPEQPAEQSQHLREYLSHRNKSLRRTRPHRSPAGHNTAPDQSAISIAFPPLSGRPKHAAHPSLTISATINLPCLSRSQLHINYALTFDPRLHPGLLRRRSTQGEIVNSHVQYQWRQKPKTKSNSLFSVLAQAGIEQVDALLLQETHYCTNGEHLPLSSNQITRMDSPQPQPTSLMVADQTPPRGWLF